MKKLTLFFTLLLVLLNHTVSAEEILIAGNLIVRPDGDGTEKNPYRITKAEELLYFSAIVNGMLNDVAKNEEAHAVLDNNIDLSTVCSEKLGSWVPIGLLPNRFKGVFDGQNHTIKNIYMDGNSYEGQGLFGCMKNAVIKNVILGPGHISSKGVSVGGIVGVGSGSIINCHNYANVFSTNKFNGGIIGYLSSNSTIERCHNEGEITSTTSNRSRFGVGGIAGAVYQDSKVKDCYNLGNIKGYSSRVGGIVGSAENCHVENCYSYADVVSVPNDYGGGLCAIAPSYPYTVVEHCYYYNKLDNGQSQQKSMMCTEHQFKKGKIFRLLKKRSPNVWKQEFNKYPVFKNSNSSSKKLK